MTAAREAESPARKATAPGEDSKVWPLTRATLILTAVLAFAAGVLVMDVVRDQRDADRWTEVARERVFWAGQDACFPGPGQRAVQTWNGDRIDCITYESWQRGLAPRAVLAFSMPALAHPLGGRP